MTWAWPRRITLAALSIAGTIAWAISFHSYGRAIAVAIGVAAGVGWLGLGITILLLRPGDATPLCWVDLCLRVQAQGMIILLLAAAMNVCRVYIHGMSHLGLLGVADLVMAAAFIHGAARLKVPWPKSLALWIAALHGSFVLGLFGFALLCQTRPDIRFALRGFTQRFS